MSDLDRAVLAVRDRDDDTALGELLGAWSANRAAELAALIEEVSQRASTGKPALANAPRTKAQAAWIELARASRPSDVPGLLAALVELLGQGPSHLAVVRLDELASRPPDPRIADALVAALAGPIGGWSDKVYVRFVKLLSLHGDPRLAASFAKAVAAREANFMDDTDRARLAKIPAAWAKQEIAPAPSGIAEVRAALAGTVGEPRAKPARPTARHDGATLLAAIYADPSDDQARAVYADHLESTGDPRGELISLQLARAAGQSTPATLAREAALLKAHRSAWLGPIAGDVVIASTEWARGFPVAAQTKIAKANAAAASFSRVEWATFERLAFASASLITPAMRALVEATGLSAVAAQKLAKLAAPPPQLRSIGLAIEYTEAPLLEHPAIAAVLALPGLRTLSIEVRWEDVTAAQVAALCAAAGAHVEELSLIGITLGKGALFAAALRDKPRALRTLRWGPMPGTTATARRMSDGWTRVELVSDCAPKTDWQRYLRDLVQGLPAGLAIEAADPAIAKIAAG